MRRRGMALAVTAAGSALAAAGLANTLRNLGRLRSPEPADAPWWPRFPGDSRPQHRVSVLVPMRDEELRARDCLEALGRQRMDEVIVLDDDSSDGTRDLAQDILGHDPRFTLLTEQGDPPPGWLGKPRACQVLADAADGDVLVFVDADVVLAPGAIVRAVRMLDRHDLDIVCPYPRQRTAGPLGRLVQPLLQWSWLTTLPLDLAEHSPRPTLTAGNGQFLVVRADAYRAAGGHAAVAGEVLEDIALVRAVKAVGGRGGMADGTELATCLMYDSDGELVEGYTKSLWSAFGSGAGAAAACAGMALAYVLPPVAMVLGPGRAVRTVGAAGYAAATVGRLLVAVRTGQRTLPDALLQPASILALIGLVGESFRRRRAGRLTWRGRPLLLSSDDQRRGTAPGAG